MIYPSANDGHIYVAPIDGGPPERVTNNPSRFHFLHGVSPAGRTLALVVTPAAVSTSGRLALNSSKGGTTTTSFPTGTIGHPADLDVEARPVRADNWSDVLTRFPLFGGQGTINVNSWSPDSRRFAFVAYPIEQPSSELARDDRPAPLRRPLFRSRSPPRARVRGLRLRASATGQTMGVII